MMRHDQRRRGSGLAAGLARDGTQRLAMQMIEVRVSDEHQIHRWQIAQIYSGLTEAFKNEKPAREIGIDDDVLASDLKEETGVPDKGDAEFAIRGELRFVSRARARSDDGVAHEPGELSRSLAERGIFQRGL